VRIGNVDRVTCKIGKDGFYCDVATFDGERKYLGLVENLLFGDVRGYANRNRLEMNFSKEQNAVCEVLQVKPFHVRELRCRATRHVTPP